MLHPMAPTLSEMVVAAMLTARRAARVPVDPGELERYAQRVLGRRWLWRPRGFPLPCDPVWKSSLAIFDLRSPGG